MMLEREKAFLKQLDKNYYSDSISDELLENASLDFLIELIKWSRSFYIRIPLEKRLMSLKLTQVAVEYGTYLGHIPKEHYFYDICLQATLNNSLSFKLIHGCRNTCTVFKISKGFNRNFKKHIISMISDLSSKPLEI